MNDKWMKAFCAILAVIISNVIRLITAGSSEDEQKEYILREIKTQATKIVLFSSLLKANLIESLLALKYQKSLLDMVACSLNNIKCAKLYG